MPTRIPVNVSLPKDLVDEVDQVAGKRGRSAFIEEALKDELRRERMRRAWESAAGSLRPEDYPEWATAEMVQEWVRERRREQTDAGPERDVSAA